MPFDDTINDISAIGGLPFFLVISALLIVTTPPEHQLALALTLIGGLVVCIGLTAGIRLIWFRNRPQPIEHKTTFQRIDASSFPSLHAMRIAFLAAVFDVVGNFSWWMVIATTLITAAVCYARVRKKRHHLSDVVVGAVIGYIIGFGVLVLMVRVLEWL